MKLLISCVKPAGGVYSLDTESGSVEKVLDDDTTGMAIVGDKFVRVLRSEDALEVLDREFKPIRHIRGVRNSDYHDLRVQDGVVTLVATERTSIDLYDLEFNLTGSLRLHHAHDPWHLNSAILLDDHSMLVSVFDIATTDEGWRETVGRGAGKVLVLHSEDEHLTAMNGLNAPHSLVSLGNWGHFGVCDSGVSAVKWRRGQYVDTVQKGGGFTRGLLHVPDGWIVGVSQPRHPSTWTGEQSLQKASVVHFDEQDGAILNRWTIPSPEIYDIVEDVR